MRKVLKTIYVIVVTEIFILQVCTSIAENKYENEIINTQAETLNIPEFIKEAESYTKESMPDINLNELLANTISGNIDNVKLIRLLWRLLGKEVLNSATTISSILVIIIIHSILVAINSGKMSKNVVNIAYYVQYIMIVTIVMTNFSTIITMVKETVQKLIMFSNSLVPLLITLLITTGNISSASVLEPIILFMITLIGNLIVDIIIPLILVFTALGIISQVSERIQIDKLSKFFKSSAVWILGVVLTLFVGVSSLESSLSSSIDGVTSKTTKAAVSNFIPVVGKILGDAVDTVMGCSIILKNALGLVGIIIIIGICIIPILKIACLSAMYKLVSAVCQPIADAKIIKLLDHIGDVFKLLLRSTVRRIYNVNYWSYHCY